MERERKIETVTLSTGHFEEALETLIPRLQAILDKHPDAELVCEVEYDYGDSSVVNVEVNYTRDETDEEMQERVQQDTLREKSARRDALERDYAAFAARGMDFPDQAELDELRSMDLRTPLDKYYEEYRQALVRTVFGHRLAD